MNLLIVDDEQSIARPVQRSRSNADEAVAVATAEEALEVLEHSPIDIF